MDINALCKECDIDLSGIPEAELVLYLMQIKRANDYMIDPVMLGEAINFVKLAGDLRKY